MVKEYIKNLYKIDTYKINFIKNFLKVFDYKKCELVWFNLNKQQEEFIKLMYDKPYAICKKGRQLGVTQTAVAGMLSKALFSPCNSTFVYVIPNICMANDIYSKFKTYINQLLKTNVLYGAFVFKKDCIEFSNGTKIYICTPSNIRDKVNRNVNSIIIDEVSFIKDEEIKNLLYYLRKNSFFLNTHVLFIGTPNNKNYFYYMYKIFDNKYSMDWWNDPRFNTDIIWYKNDFFLHTPNTLRFNELFKKGWLPINSWFMKICNSFNMDFNKINQEINNQFI